MKAFSRAINHIGTESAFAVGPEIAAIEKEGYRVIRLNIGEPSCAITSAATQAIINSLKNHQTHYTPSKGLESLRKKIAHYLTVTREIKYTPEDIVLTPGAKPVISSTMFILINPNDEVIYPTPSYPIYESMIDFTGAKKKPLLLKEKKGFRFDIGDLNKAVSNKTKLLVLNSPSNPTGGVLLDDDLKEIAKIVKKNDLYVLSDEIYSRIIFDTHLKKINYNNSQFYLAPSITGLPGMSERTLIMDGFSKTYAMTGLRLGYVATKNKKFIDKFLTYAINIWSCLPEPLMKGAEAVLEQDQEEVQKEVEYYHQKRDIAVDMLNKIDGISCHKPLGAFYLFPNVTGLIKKLGLKDAEELRKYLLTSDKKNKRGVAVLARKHFGEKLKEENQEYIRISIAGPLKSIKEGILLIKKLCSN